MTGTKLHTYLDAQRDKYRAFFVENLVLKPRNASAMWM